MFEVIQKQNTKLVGIISYLVGSICFALCSLPISATAKAYGDNTSAFVFSRFLLGFLIFSLPFFIKRRTLIVDDFKKLILRGVVNYFAVYFFFLEARISSSAKANIFVQSYPVFVLLYSLIVHKTKRELFTYLLTAFSMFGVLLTLQPSFSGFNLSSFPGIMSAITTALSLIVLNVLREKHSTETILAYLFLVGIICSLIQGNFNLAHTPISIWPHVLVSGIFGILAQWFATYGIKYLNELEAAIVGSSRILAALGLTLIFNFEQSLTISVIIGSCIIIFSNIFIIRKKLT